LTIIEIHQRHVPSKKEELVTRNVRL